MMLRWCKVDRGRQGGRAETGGFAEVARHMAESCQKCCWKNGGCKSIVLLWLIDF